MHGKTALATILATSLSAPLFAQSDPPGSREYFMFCRPCHSVTDPEGTRLMIGSGLGSDLYGIIDSPAAMQEGFDYSDALREAADMGLVWTVENIVDYAADPRGFLRAYIGNPRAEVTMTYSFERGLDEIIAYLRAVGPQAE
jgi:cytochrome c